MPCPSFPRGVLLLLCSMLVPAVAGSSACARASGDDEATAPFGVEVNSMYIRVENRTGTALVGGKIEIIPAGRMVVFTTSFPRMEIRAKRDFNLDQFRGTDGTPFRYGVIRARSVKVKATDLLGKEFVRTVPFE